MIEKEFVPYEEALALKELGFDEPCLSYWDDDKVFELNPEFLKGSEMDSTWLTRPTFSQAFRWFRYKYWYTALILCDSFQIVMQLSTSKTLDSNTGEYSPVYITQTYHKEVGLKSYDESELACLKKLIEISKNK
jgi:hypothetical protein